MREGTRQRMQLDDPTRVRWAPDFLARLERFVAASSAAIGREDAAARARAGGGGDEFVGHRPYRAGEDLRDFDWELFARLERPFVRLRRRESGERWCVLLDTSASMGLGRPGKLQLAAETAAAIALRGVTSGAVTTLVAHAVLDASHAIEAAPVRRRADLGGALAFLEARRAAGRRSLRELVADPRVRSATRVFVLGDLFDVEPRDLLVLVGRGRSFAVLRILAPHELSPTTHEGVEWLDPETSERLDLRVEEPVRAAYGEALERRLEAWRERFAAHGQRVVVSASDAAFEDAAAAVLA